MKNVLLMSAFIISITVSSFASAYASGGEGGAGNNLNVGGAGLSPSDFTGTAIVTPDWNLIFNTLSGQNGRDAKKFSKETCSSQYKAISIKKNTLAQEIATGENSDPQGLQASMLDSAEEAIESLCIGSLGQKEAAQIKAASM